MNFSKEQTKLIRKCVFLQQQLLLQLVSKFGGWGNEGNNGPKKNEWNELQKIVDIISDEEENDIWEGGSK